MLGTMRSPGQGRRCRRCGDPIQWGAVRLVGSHTYCSEACAIISLADEASRTAWARAMLELSQGTRGLHRWGRLALACGRARLAQWRLDRRLNAGPRAEILPWIWVPPRPAAAGLVLVLVAWGAAGGRAPETRAMVPIPAMAPTGFPGVATPGLLPESPPPRLAIPQERPRLAVRTTPVPPPQPRPIPRVVAEDITRGNPAIREIAFTFDGGDEANIGDEILAMLRARGVRVTVFLTGQFIRLFPDLVRHMVADGHEIANHLDTHPRLTTYAQNRRHQTLPGVSREFLIGQLRRAETSFRTLTGQPMAPYWRAPYGEHNAEIRAWAAEAGYRHISWTRGAGMAEDLDTRDWVADRSSRIYRSREEIATRILEFGRGRPEGLNGGIILMHLATHRRTDRPHESLPHVLNTLQNQGYRLVTVSELLDHLDLRQVASRRSAGRRGLGTPQEGMPVEGAPENPVN